VSENKDEEVKSVSENKEKEAKSVSENKEKEAKSVSENKEKETKSVWFKSGWKKRLKLWQVCVSRCKLAAEGLHFCPQNL